MATFSPFLADFGQRAWCRYHIIRHGSTKHSPGSSPGKIKAYAVQGLALCRIIVNVLLVVIITNNIISHHHALYNHDVARYLIHVCRRVSDKANY